MGDFAIQDRILYISRPKFDHLIWNELYINGYSNIKKKFKTLTGHTIIVKRTSQ